jgi:integrase
MYPPPGMKYKAAKAAGVLKESSIIWLKYRDALGVLRRESSETDKEQEARRLLKKREGDSVEARITPPRAEKVTVGELLDMVVADYEREKHRSLATLLFRLQRIRRFFNNRRAVNVDNDTCTAYAKQRLAEGAKESTINREFAVVGRAFKLGIKLRKITSQPVITLFTERNVRKGFVNPDAFEQILYHLIEAGSEAVADVAEFAWLTASRRGACFGLQWSHVDRNESLITFPAEIEKNGEPRQIPIVGRLHDLIEKRWKARKLGCEYIFHRNGRRIKAIAASWASACNAAGVPGLLFHDLRRSAVGTW